ncbi:hypothetical protein B0H10DRAFT_1875405 [Mycena sp. CBHHK59/15]|nr:hypothetical protein B0H10DRAFT_1875405 [Mycena sp. CBHHK59/15]
MALAALTISSVFTKKQVIADIVKNFDFSKVDVKDSTRNDYLHEGLAPSFGGLNSESIKLMDDKLKIMIAGTMRVLSKIPPPQRSWDKVIETMMQNTLLEPVGSDNINRVDKFIKEGTNVFKFDGSPDTTIMREVETWFTNLINDEDVLKSTKIDINVVGAIVAQTGATIDAIETLIYKSESHEKTLVDIGVLRFPDIDNPYFKVYHIKLVAWSQSQRILMVQNDTNGITGVYNCRKFKPRASVINGMKKEVKQKAISEAEHIFD